MIKALEKSLTLENDDTICDALWILSNMFSSEDEDVYAERMLLGSPTLLIKIVHFTENTRAH